MSLTRPALIALPLAAFVVTMIALVGHAATGDAVWYQVALSANLGGLAVASLGMLAGIADAAELPAFTVARDASLRHVGFSVLALICFAATASVIDHPVDDVAPLTLGALGLTAMVVAGWYGRAVLLAFELGQTIVRYPARMRSVDWISRSR